MKIIAKLMFHFMHLSLWLNGSKNIGNTDSYIMDTVSLRNVPQMQDQ